MQITYGGKPIATEPPAGTDGVLGFMVPRGEQNFQWMEGLRAADSYPIARFNRKRTISGSIYPAALTTLAAALQARTQFYENLPASGPLVIQQDAQVETFNYAVLQTIEVLEAVTEGVSYGLKFSFLVGPPGANTANNVLQTGSGSGVLEDGRGNELGIGT